MIFLLNKWGHMEIFAIKFVWFSNESDKRPFLFIAEQGLLRYAKLLHVYLHCARFIIPRIPPYHNQILFRRGQTILTAWWIIFKAGMDNRLILRIDVPATGLTIKCIVTKSIDSDTELRKDMLTFGLVTPGMCAYVKPRIIRVVNDNQNIAMGIVGAILN